MFAALLLGLAGSLHCVGMCGPIALIVPSPQGNGRIMFALSRLVYNLGRTLTYALLGLAAGAAGHVLVHSGFQRSLSIFAGAFVLAGVLLPALHQRLSLQNITAGFNARWRRLQAWLFGQRHLGGVFGIGILNGFLPCGLLYTALAGAAAMGTAASGSAFMAVFGLGTIPALLILAMGARATRFRVANLPSWLLPGMAAIFGVLLILRGLALDIPMLSPMAQAACH